MRHVAGAESRARHLHAAAVGRHHHPDQLVEVLGRRVLAFGYDDPALLGERRGVHVVHLLLGVSLEHSVQHRGGEESSVELGEPALEGHLDPIDRPGLAERHREPAEPAAQREEGAEHLHVLRPDRGDVDGVRDEASVQRGDHLLGGDHAGAVLGLGG